MIVYGKDAAMATILTHARRFPMMAQRQVVIVKEAQDIQDINKESGYKLLLDYLTRQVPSTILVFCHKNKTLDKRRELGKKIDQLAVTYTSKKLYDNQLPEFVSEYVKEKKIPIEDRAVQALCGVCRERPSPTWPTRSTRLIIPWLPAKGLLPNAS